MSPVRRVAAVIALALAPVLAAPAYASGVVNDTVAGAIVVDGDLPWHHSQDTTAASTEPVDQLLVDSCGLAFAVERTVWFRYTDDSGAGFGVDPTASDYSSSVAIVEGDPENGGIVVACGEDEIAAKGAAGQTYWIAAFADRPGSTGGILDLVVRALKPAPTASLTIDDTALMQRDGTVLVRGSYACTDAPAHASSIRGEVARRSEASKPRSNFFLPELRCDGTAHPWMSTAQSFDGPAVMGGRAVVDAVLFACGDLACAASEVEQTVRVAPGW